LCIGGADISGAAESRRFLPLAVLTAAVSVGCTIAVSTEEVLSASIGDEPYCGRSTEEYFGIRVQNTYTI
jgi:hypothetical protein